MRPFTATRAWFFTLNNLLKQGQLVSPRGITTRELLQHTMIVDMNYPVVQSSTRKVSTKFLGAESYWILTGDQRVETIAPYNPNIARFSDDGVKFFGAYGPKVVSQLDYVVKKLQQDPDSRQAGLTIWRENPPDTKDVPCTIAMFFNLRGGKLNTHVFMRSSDIWLGVPYDVFNFSMVSALVLAQLNRVTTDWSRPYHLGALYLTAASRHVYQSNFDAANEVLVSDPWDVNHNPVPLELYTDENSLYSRLDRLRSGDKQAKWWLP